MELRNKICAFFSDVLRCAQEKNHQLAEKNRLKASIARAEHSRNLAYLSLGRHYYELGNADEAAKPYFERIDRSTARIEKASGMLETIAENARQKKKGPQIPPVLKLELETETIISQIERETDAILLPEKESRRQPRSEKEEKLIRSVSAPAETPEECALDDDRNVPWE